MRQLLKYGLLIWLLADVSAGRAQNFYVLGGTLHTGDGRLVEHAAITVEDGRILSISDARRIRIDPSFGPVTEAYGKHIYPGLVAAYTTLGLSEVDYLRPTRDYDEVGEFTPNIRSMVAYNTDSRIIPTLRSNGILYTQVVPKGGLISGTSSVMKTSGWNWEAAVALEGDGVHLWWPSMYTSTGWWGEPGVIVETTDYRDKVAHIRGFLEKARAYLASPRLPKDIVLESMEGVFTGERNLYLHVQGAAEIEACVRMAIAMDIPNPVVVGGEGAEAVTALLKTHDVPVMLTTIHKLPPRRHCDIDHWYKLPAVLHDAGIRFCLTHSEMNWQFNGSWEHRSLPFLAGTAAAYGLSREAALASITSSVADILRMDYTGILTEGAEATFIISEGDLLDMRSSRITHAWQQGESLDLDDKQKRLYEKFRSRLKSQGDGKD